jgi:hypothetical protein
MENMIFKGGKAASCTLKLDSKPSDEAVKNIKTGENVIQVLLK